MSNNRTYTIAVCGAKATGKTNMCSILTNKTPSDIYTSTIGVDLMIKMIPKKDIKLNFWDLAGDSRFEEITRTYVKRADMILYLYRIDDIHTINIIKKLNRIYEEFGYTDRCIIIGTYQSDIDEVNFSTCANSFAEKKGYSHFLFNFQTQDGKEKILEKIYENNGISYIEDTYPGDNQSPKCFDIRGWCSLI